MVDLNDLVLTLVAVLRANGHLCNVLTHIGSGKWQNIEQAIASILAPRTQPDHLDAVGRNVLELICDGRGVTGPIMRAVFFGAIAQSVSQRDARRLRGKIARLRSRMAAADLARRTRPAAPEYQPDAAPPRLDPTVPYALPPFGSPGVSNHRKEDAMQAGPVSRVEFDAEGISVDAALIAGGLGLDPAAIPSRMRVGEIKAVCERGIDTDAGLYRLTFFRPGYRVRLVVGTDGEIRQRSSISFGEKPGSPASVAAA